jgi:hypothetical protein
LFVDIGDVCSLNKIIKIDSVTIVLGRD